MLVLKNSTNASLVMNGPTTNKTLGRCIFTPQKDGLNYKEVNCMGIIV